MPRVAASSTRRRTRNRVGAVLLLLLAVVGVLSGRDTPDAAATPGDEATFVDALNEVRIESGLLPFTVNTELAVLARAHAQAMADAGEIFHADPLSAGYRGPWSKIGENVGVGASVSVLVDAFLASPGHYANIIDPAFTEIGVGVVWKDGALYTAHRFLQVTDPVPSLPEPPVTAPPTTLPAGPTTTAPDPGDPPEPIEEPNRLAPPDVESARIVALLELLAQVGT